MWQRIKPALLLVLLAPLIAEYLLGSLPFSMIGLFPLMAIMYGTGALFIREAVRRFGYGWPTIITLGIAYGVIEEGLATQSLFNPNYLHLRLLDRGFIPELGIGLPWTIYVILLHVVWSIAVPIGLVEAISSERRTTPWLGKIGLTICGIAYGLGTAMVTMGSWSQEHFVASKAQLTSAALIALLFVIVAFTLFRPRQNVAAAVINSHNQQRQPVSFGIMAFAIGSAFHILPQFLAPYLTVTTQVSLALLLPTIVIAAVYRMIRSGEWTTAHTDGLVLGGLGAYCWLGFVLAGRLHGPSAVLGQLFPLTIITAVIYFGIIRKKFGRRA